MALGAGTIMTVDEVKRAADAGASFIVSESGCQRHRSHEETPSCFTARLLHAFGGRQRRFNAGADAVKLFPATSLGQASSRRSPGRCPECAPSPLEA
jgi:2-keto-3-deoxy-6-phosphogluconate aldolase